MRYLHALNLFLGIAIYQTIVPSVLGSRFCQWSKQTAEAVSSCPRNKSVMVERAKIKNCEATAKIQNCTDPEKFKFHCVMNELETEFIELCAPQYYIHGHCTEYNSLGAAIQEHFSLKCSDVKPPCNASYLSTDAYLYKGCYKMVKRNTQLSSTDFSTNHVIQITTVNYLSNYKSEYTYIPIIIIVGAIAAVAAIILIATCTRREAASWSSLCSNETTYETRVTSTDKKWRSTD